MNVETVFSVISLLGIGGLIGTYFRILWERRNSTLLQKQDFKERRYKCIIVLAMCLLDFDETIFLLSRMDRGYIKTTGDLIFELKSEWNNMILFSSDKVLSATHSFILSPSQDSFRKMALAMREDLWGGKLSLEKLNSLELL